MIIKEEANELLKKGPAVWSDRNDRNEMLYDDGCIR